MVKPDWSELQDRFLSEHAESGVSPKEWCESQGLNYATARRYIKKPAQSAQKSAQRKTRSAQKLECAEAPTISGREWVDKNKMKLYSCLFRNI